MGGRSGRTDEPLSPVSFRPTLPSPDSVVQPAAAPGPFHPVPRSVSECLHTPTRPFRGDVACLAPAQPPPGDEYSDS